MIKKFNDFIRLYEDADSTVSDPEVESAWQKVYGKELKEEYPNIFKILKKRPPVDKKELNRIWSESFGKSFEEDHPKVYNLLFSEK